MTPRKAPRLFAPILIVLTVLGIEALSLPVDLYLRSKGVFYKPSPAADYADYLAERDPVLGWPAPGTFGKDGRRDATGSRITPAFPDPAAAPACVSLYGDSFTWSSEVDSAHAWSNVLSKLLGCRVANYGVGGYGTDQAYLRFLHNPHDQAPVVVLNHFSDNILRNVNQFRDLLYPGGGKGFKPRFILDEGGGLTLIPLPVSGGDEYRNVVSHPEDFLLHDYFRPGGPAGVLELRFPFSVSLVRALGHFNLRAKLTGRRWYEPFYEEEHGSGALEVTAAIMRAFRDHAVQTGRTPVLTVLPGGDDLRLFVREGRWAYQPLLDALGDRGIPVLNVGEGLIEGLGGRDPCGLFGDCDAHYNEDGYAEVARVVLEHLTHTGLVEPR